MVAKTYEHISQKRDWKKIESRKDAALIAQLRSGHCLKLAHYRHRIDESKPESCPRCDEALETVTHWLQCPATIQQRMTAFGRASVSLGVLTEDPARALAFAKATLC